VLQHGRTSFVSVNPYRDAGTKYGLHCVNESASRRWQISGGLLFNYTPLQSLFCNRFSFVFHFLFFIFHFHFSFSIFIFIFHFHFSFSSLLFVFPSLHAPDSFASIDLMVSESESRQPMIAISWSSKFSLLYHNGHFGIKINCEINKCNLL
jgi:hypothetical protein